jgi:hypothetical protein
MSVEEAFDQHLNAKQHVTSAAAASSASASQTSQASGNQYQVTRAAVRELSSVSDGVLFSEGLNILDNLNHQQELELSLFIAYVSWKSRLPKKKKSVL